MVLKKETIIDIISYIVDTTNNISKEVFFKVNEMDFDNLKINPNGYNYILEFYIKTPLKKHLNNWFRAIYKDFWKDDIQLIHDYLQESETNEVVINVTAEPLISQKTGNTYYKMVLHNPKLKLGDIGNIKLPIEPDK
jgi:hypothetical protein